MHAMKYLEPTKKAIEDAEVFDEEKKEEYNGYSTRKLQQAPWEN